MGAVLAEALDMEEPRELSEVGDMLEDTGAQKGGAEGKQCTKTAQWATDQKTPAAESAMSQSSATSQSCTSAFRQRRPRPRPDPARQPACL